MSELRLAVALVLGLSVPVLLVIGLSLTARTVVWLVRGDDAMASLSNQVRGLAYIVAASAALVLWSVVKP